MRALVMLVCLLTLVACEQAPEPPAEPTSTSQTAPWLAAEKALTNTLQEETDKRLRRLTASATGFSDAIDGLLSDPTEERLATARQAWSQLYQNYNEAFVVLLCRATQSPVDLTRLERADSFPILPGYIDGLEQWPDSGIVNDMSLPLTREALLEQQGATLEGEASVGFQVIHFLLNGEPGTLRQADALHAVTELTDDMLGDLDDQPANRRRTYLLLATELLVEDLTLMARPDSLALQVNAECPVGAMREAVARLLRLEGLRDHTQVSQDFMDAGVRDAAGLGLQKGLTPWLAPEGALAVWLSERLVSNRALPEAAPAIDAENRVAELQAIHASLAATEKALR